MDQNMMTDLFAKEDGTRKKKLSIIRDYFFTLKFISNLVTFARVFKLFIYVNNLAKCIILTILII